MVAGGPYACMDPSSCAQEHSHLCSVPMPPLPCCRLSIHLTSLVLQPLGLLGYLVPSSGLKWFLPFLWIRWSNDFGFNSLKLCLPSPRCLGPIQSPLSQQMAFSSSPGWPPPHASAPQPLCFALASTCGPGHHLGQGCSQAGMSTGGAVTPASCLSCATG